MVEMSEYHDVERKQLRTESIVHAAPYNRKRQTQAKEHMSISTRDVVGKPGEKIGDA